MLAAAALAVAFVSHSSDGAQINQLRAALGRVQGQQSQVNVRVSGQLGNLSDSMSSLSGLVKFTGMCFQDFTGPDGNPHTYGLPCVIEKS